MGNCDSKGFHDTPKVIHLVNGQKPRDPILTLGTPSATTASTLSVKITCREQSCCTQSIEPTANRKAIFPPMELLSVTTLGRRKGKLRLSLLPHTKRKQMAWVFNLALKF